MARQKKSSADATAAQAQGERHPCDHPGCQKVSLVDPVN